MAGLSFFWLADGPGAGPVGAQCRRRPGAGCIGSPVRPTVRRRVVSRSATSNWPPEP